MDAVTRTGQVWSPVITPFNERLDPDARRFAAHCQWLIDQDVGLAIFGTNSEANSLTVQEKCRLLDALVEQGVSGERLMPGVGSCSIGDTVALTQHVVKSGGANVLMLPPFYYKGVSEEGLFRYFSEVIERAGSSNLRVYLYHIPPVSQVPISLALVERLKKRYPTTIAGLKDSSGEWENTASLIDAFGDDMNIYAGSEHFLLQTLRAGGAGCISATANVNPAPIAALARHFQKEDADSHQQVLSQVRRVFEGFPMIPALKTAAAHYGGDDTWNRLRPPLVELSKHQCNELCQALDELNFSMPDYATSV
ncbi:MULTISPECIES: dihydrodipicolinate synthase family protein [unclassified Halomonas]|uniref:dihydrodipicolinate synthase family protein n=1 Tax=unclassified Halomonas TaxID=2609666 RepID=UPI00209FA95C|nr:MULTISPECIES: dihydrodipicolinate synthase family protein [unclassified Halomonas]MCP1313201.1 dihydrodipicolinate synthase family protein [Halomonas sp. 707D7]MCP1325864.1 dihydrodipicolinate synthase family protein [Halomonas sp. 707D4]